MTLDEAARHLAAVGIESPRAEARLLLAHALGLTRDQTLAPPALTPPQAVLFAALIARRAGREPSAYITGHKEFWSMDFEVGPGVLVPRPESETLIEEALRAVPDLSAPLMIGDLGAGSGILLCAALREFPNAMGLGFESSPRAFAYAAANTARLMPGRAEIRLADWSEAPRGGFDLIFSNPPYIPSDEIASLDADVAQHEPRAALDGGPDGLAAYRSLSVLLPELLKPGGRAVLEIGYGQAAAMKALFQGSGLDLARISPDLAGVPRVVLLEKARSPLGKAGLVH